MIQCYLCVILFVILVILAILIVLLGGQPETHQALWSLSKASKHGIKNLLFHFFFLQ